jgi:uncharacterized membrane protein YhaH (DUF805 family)
MTLPESVKTVLVEKYVTFSGRASRSDFWWFQLVLFLGAIAAILVGTVLAVVFGAFSGGGTDFIGPAMTFMFVPVGLFYLAVLLPVLAVTVRRLHDRNLSGWWYLAFIVLSIIPFVGFLAGIALIVILILEGTNGPNKFGADPLRPQATADVFA